MGNVYCLDRAPSDSLGIRVSRWRALRASLGVSVLFVALYSFCNWITAHRIDVGTLNFTWERRIPFVPIFIIPYLSIDLFFVATPFLCRTEQELQIFTRRTSGAILAGSICFLLFPFRFAFSKPATNSSFAKIVEWFAGLDRPYNLLPSLHIALLILIGQVYLRHTAGILRKVLMVWFGLIAISTVLTYQHHVLDVVGGALLAVCCCYCFREVPTYKSLHELRSTNPTLF